MATDAILDGLLSDHRAAVAEFVSRVEQVAPGRWNTPRGAGKWTPGQEVTHVLLAYDAFIRDLRGGAPMRLVGNRWKRFMWRAIGLTSILHLRRIPVAARAPREARPPEETVDLVARLAEFRARVGEFETLYAESWRRAPRKQVAHPYFGMLSLRQSMVMATVHTRHHAVFLAQSARKEPEPGQSARAGRVA